MWVFVDFGLGYGYNDHNIFRMVKEYPDKYIIKKGRRNGT